MSRAEGEGREPDETLVGPANGRLPLELDEMLDWASGEVGDGRVGGMVS